ncbi:hypothetical protein CWO90_44355 [Bradyrhizobium sp. Leo121]|nr:hypothetical protein CWO90_44355 [Bradyrhizobium sp. Leo121]
MAVVLGCVLPSLGVSSLDFGRLWQRRRPFLCQMAADSHGAPVIGSETSGRAVNERHHRYQSSRTPKAKLDELNKKAIDAITSGKLTDGRQYQRNVG